MEKDHMKPRSNDPVVETVLSNISATEIAKVLGCAPGDHEVVRLDADTVLIRKPTHLGSAFYRVTVEKVPT